MEANDDFEVVVGFRFMVVPKWILDKGPNGSTLSSSAVHIYTALLSYANNDTHECYPSHNTLAELVGKSVSTVRRALDELKDFGAITWRGRLEGDTTNQTSNTYYLPQQRGEVQVTFSDNTDSEPVEYEAAENTGGFEVPKGVQKNFSNYEYIQVLGECFGYQPETSKQYARFNAAVNEMKPHCTTPKDIKVAFDKYPKFMPKGATRTIEALAKHFADIMGAQTDKTIGTLERLESLKNEEVVQF